ncbi:hypothetical protein GWC77_17175 [Paraburkholderia sp. NMBU_R16]|nr:hypothetical protein [Paraburkholderia sp. NMBU_R16]
MVGTGELARNIDVCVRSSPDPAMTLAAVDRLVHHSTIFELNAESRRDFPPNPALICRRAR